MKDLPFETLLEIFYKLPVKQLHRNKIVCKLWLSLISHPSFRSQYLIRRNSSHSLTLYLIFHDPKSHSFVGKHLTNVGESSISWSKVFSLNFLPRTGSDHNVVLASSNGLLLCTNTYYYYVCNPVTKQWVALPYPPTDSRFTLSGIVCYPSSESADGLTTQAQFKVVRIVSRDYNKIESKVLNMEIFESSTNKWRVFKKTFDARIVISSGGVNVNAVEHKGIFYWRSIESNSIIAFDPNLDLCFQIPLPETEGQSFRSVFGASRDHLYYVMIDLGRGSISCTVWRCDEFEGKYNWKINGCSNLDWISQQVQQISFYHCFNCVVLGIDPMDCNVLYFTTFDRRRYGIGIRPVYSLDLERREMKHIGSFSLDLGKLISSLTIVQAAWPTSFPLNIGRNLHELSSFSGWFSKVKRSVCQYFKFPRP